MIFLSQLLTESRLVFVQAPFLQGLAASRFFLLPAPAGGGTAGECRIGAPDFGLSRFRISPKW